MANENPAPVERDYLLPNKLYDVLKRVNQLVLPAFASLYYGLAALWGWPNAEGIVATCALLATFFGVLLEVAKASFDNSDAKYGGSVEVVTDEDGKKLVNLMLPERPEDLLAGATDDVILKVI